MSVTCPACSFVSRENRPPGGILLREGGFLLHGIAGPTPVPGWAVLTSERHVRGVYELSDDEWRALGPLIARVMRAQKSALGAEHVYLFAIGDVLHHAHLHLVPRYADTPERLRGRGAFDARPEEHLSADQVERALETLRLALGR